MVSPTTGPDPVLTELPLWQDIGIVDLNAQGEGVGRHEGQVVFIPFTIPGEIIDAAIQSRRPSFSRGEVATLRLPAPTRATPPCAHFTVCGGCQYQHIAYPAQPEIAAASVHGNLRKLLKGWDLPDAELIPSSQAYGYRTQTRLQFRREPGHARVPGYVDLQGQVLVIERCPVLHPSLERVLLTVLAHLREARIQEQLQKLDMRFLTLQCNQAGSEVALLFHTFELLNIKKHWDRELWGEMFVALQSAHPEVVGLVLDNGQKDIGFGQNYTAEANALAPYVPIGAFKQNNPDIEHSIYALVQRWIQPAPGERGIDAYCGRGELTARLAQAAPGSKVTGIESAPAWFDHGQHINAGEIPAAISQQIRFVQHTVEQWVPGQSTVDWMVCNPPRKGMEAPVIDWLLALGPQRWAYISCNPATFARDCAPLAGTYRITRLACLDMFPQTAKMELVALLER